LKFEVLKFEVLRFQGFKVSSFENLARGAGSPITKALSAKQPTRPQRRASCFVQTRNQNLET